MSQNKIASEKLTKENKSLLGKRKKTGLRDNSGSLKKAESVEVASKVEVKEVESPKVVEEVPRKKAKAKRIIKKEVPIIEDKQPEKQEDKTARSLSSGRLISFNEKDKEDQDSPKPDMPAAEEKASHEVSAKNSIGN